MATVLDFQIRPGKDNTFPVEVFERDNSQPLVSSTFEYDLSFMTDFELSHLDDKPKTQYERLERRKSFGSKLYQKLFTSDIEKTWQEYKEKSDFLVLCLRIAPEAEKLEVLPWETLYDSEEFIAAGARTGMTRLPLDISPQKDLPPLPMPIQMLALLSSPLDLKAPERLAIEKEQEILLRATNSPSGQGRLKVEFEDEAKLPVIESTLESGYQIFHYSGHGIDPEYGGGLLLEDPTGKKRFTRVEEILHTLEKGIKSFRLAVLSGCQTARTLYASGFQDLARKLVRRKVPAVIAMQFSITDKGGLLFAETLYPRLAEGQPLDMAVSASRRVLLHTDDPMIQADALAPVLILSSPRPLKTKEKDSEAVTETFQVSLDFDYYVPLPQLNFGFYGRRREYRAIRDGLLYKNQRAIIVHGIGGIGKTALISHAASRLKKSFKGIYAFDCRSGTLAPETILLELHRFLERQKINALGQLLHQSFPPEQLAVFMGQVLSQIPILIIFDNFETQLSFQEGKHQITDPNLKIFLEMLIKTTSQCSCYLFTCRYIFDIDEKRVGPVRYLPLDDLSRPEALGLMQNLPHLAAACFEDQLQALKVFGGHPYGLVTLDRHCGRKSLVDAIKDAQKVHLELREFLAIEINYTKLSEKSRELLNRLAAFRKPVEWEAVHWVIGSPIDVSAEFLKQLDRKKMPEEMQKMSDEELIRLIKQSLPEKRQAKDVDEPVRELIEWGLLTPIEEEGEVILFTIHSLVRDFCRDKCQDTWKQYLEDAAAYYTNQSEGMEQDRKTFGIVMEEIEAAELLMEAGEFEPAASIIIDITPLLDRWGLGRLREALYERIIPGVKKEAQSILIHNLGILLKLRGDYQAALHQYEKSLKIKEELGNRAGVAKSLHEIGMIHQHRGNYPAALEQYEKSLKILEELGDRANMASSLHQIGTIHQHRGDYTAALEQYEKSLKILEELGDRANMASSLHQIGTIHQHRGDYPAALEQYEKSLKIREELGDRAGVAQSLHQIGMIHQARGDYPAALEQYEKSLKIFEELGDRANMANSLHQIGMIHQARGDYPAALEQYEKSLKIEEELGNRDGVARSHAQLGKLFTETKKYQEAFEHLLISLNIFAELQSPNARIVVNDLIKLRTQWGAEHFDAAWQEKTGEEVPDFLKEKPQTKKTKGKKKGKR
jgi:tetratricopeptide (TPR) repeat protein/CHAT domain-containing protein